MDIQKELASYKKYRNSKINAFGFQISDFKNIDEYLGFLTWLSAKAQAKHEINGSIQIPEGFVLVPKEPTKDMQDALGFMCFQIIGVAELYRKLGFDIPYKAEAEQAFFLYRFMHLALEHGENWKSVFNAETQAMIEAQEKNND